MKTNYKQFLIGLTVIFVALGIAYLPTALAVDKESPFESMAWLTSIILVISAMHILQNATEKDQEKPKEELEKKPEER